MQYARSLIEASLDPLIIINIEGRITDMNEALANITGLSSEELKGTDFFNYFTAPQKALEACQQIFKNGAVSNYSLTIQHKEGKLTDVFFNGAVYKNDKGIVLGAVIFARDIAEQKWAEKLRIANNELAFQNDEMEKRAEESVIANKELAYQNDEKEKRAEELVIANIELAYQNNEKEKRAEELSIANKELAYQNDEKGKRADELVIANKELAYQNDEKGKRADELVIANKELAYQNDEKGKRADELVIANKELAYQNDEKGKRADELVIANKELAYQNDEKGKRADELVIANKELAYQNDEKGKRADELVIANKELRFQNNEKEKRAAELLIANKELIFQNNEKEKQKIVNKELEVLSNSLKLASQYSLSLIEASRDPLFTINPKGKITDTNEASVNVTGVSRKKLIGSDFINYFTDSEEARKGYLEVFNKGFIADYPLTIKDHQLTDVLLNGSVYKNEQGKVLGVVVVARDITEQKRIEKESIEARLFAELATEIAEEAKINAEFATVIAENAVKAKQQFLSNMSHEIRTPMNAIIGFTKVVLKTELTVKQKEYLNAIKMSGDALIVLINDILDLAKVDAGKMVFEKTPFKMNSSITAMLHLFETKIQEKNLRLVTEYDNKIPDVLVGDPVRLHQIILNLVSNAVKFTTKGTITVSVNMLHEDEDKVIIEFAVNDTGIGIPKQKIDTIFDNFQQATSGTSRLYGGTGLGLAIVKQLVEPQGGKIRVKSSVNIGTTFSFTLSFQKTDADAQLQNELIELDSEIKNIKVLVVEDIALNQLLMKTLLDDFGFQRDIAENGKIAIEKLQNNTYDIILMDLQMPIMNGFEATEYIRNTMNSKIPIIALTADVTTVDLAKCKSVGMNDYVAKPLDEKLLYSKIVGLLKKPKLEKLNIKLAENIGTENKKSEKIKCIDLLYLNKRTKSDPELMSEMISLYLAETPAFIKTIKHSLENKNWPLLQATVHKMIPSFSIMGIHPNFETMAKKIQELAKSQEIADEIHDLVEQLENICTQACEELEEELNLIKNK
ncbi:PAS domain S-box-containing protein [Flavobacterium sp. CG_23.5]|uniref:ATP-binding protein n=1 Tax=Flavobacterium sp. CG_23.5 TaxID=2760708 RepID=UPI001AEB38F4|nr:ATP-binding protein [Flavobacterium sp. CG_23.5]MBP2282281.1 PAS domain S-box-containing protein [Flavobacterium sp. CG_23.5]